MKPRISVVTLGVNNLEQVRSFYEKLGWKASSMSHEHFVAFHMQGAVLCLYPLHMLAEDARASLSNHQGFKGFTLAHNVSSKKEVDEILQQAVDAGGTLIKHAQDVFWGGYSGYFADPDENLWEVAWNPHWPLNDDGALQLPI